MLKIIFMKYLRSVRPKLAPELKMIRTYWNLTYLIFQISQLRFKCQKKKKKKPQQQQQQQHLLGPN